MKFPSCRKLALLLIYQCVLLALAIAAYRRRFRENAPAAGDAEPLRLIAICAAAGQAGKARALYEVGWTLYLVGRSGALCSLADACGTRFESHFDWAQRLTRYRFLQAVIVMSLFVLVLELTQLPLDMYGHHIGLKYGTSVQHWGSWFGDWGKTLLLGFVFVSFVGWVLYGVLRRSPRRWWFYFWLALIPIIIFVMFVEPVWVEPLFEKFVPLSDHHADLVEQIERVVHRAGMEIPPDRMYEMKASEKTTTLNAYVTGFGATKRVVVWTPPCST